MRRRGNVRGGRGLILAGFITAFITAAEMPLAVFAGSLTNDKIQESEAAKQQAESQKESLKAGLTDVQKILESLETTKSDLKNYVTALDQNLATLEEKIAELGEKIQEKEREIEITKEALLKAEAIEREQYEAMKKRIRFTYERGDRSALELILSADSFADFLNKAEFINKISQYEDRMLKEYENTRKQIEEVEARLEQEQRELDEAKAAQEEQQQAVSTLISAKEKEIKVYEADISNKEQLIKEYEEEIAAQDAMIKELERAIAEEKKRLMESNGKVRTYDGGQFAFPAPNYTRISDDYGNRIHPTLNVEKFHNGIDLAAPGGSPILAAYDGTVVAAAYSGTMGNYVMLNHGDGLVTIYMHASSLLVSQGQEVVRGQEIAKVGSTGRSTGNHLHFSVRKDGSYVSPWNFIS